MVNTKKPEILPMVHSDLLEIALDDMAALRAAGKVSFEMSTWLVNKPRQKTCSVCMAGAVMLRRGLVTSYIYREDSEYNPNDCGRKNEEQLCAINEMRGGLFYTLGSPFNPEQSLVAAELNRCFSAGVMTNGLYPEKMYREAIKRLRSVGL